MNAIYTTAAIPLGIYLAWDLLETVGHYVPAVRRDLSMLAAPMAGIACAILGVTLF